MTKSIIAGALAIAVLAAWPHAQQPAQPPAPQQPSEVATTISGEGGAAPRLAVPDFIALSTDAETVATAKTIGQVLWDDLNFEREFALIPRDIYGSIPAATSFADVPFDRWRELNADGVIVGTVQKTERRRSASRCGCSTCGRGSRRSRAQYTDRREPAALRAHDRRRDPQAAARAARRGAHRS